MRLSEDYGSVKEQYEGVLAKSSGADARKELAVRGGWLPERARQQPGRAALPAGRAAGPAAASRRPGGPGLTRCRRRARAAPQDTLRQQDWKIERLTRDNRALEAANVELRARLDELRDENLQAGGCACGCEGLGVWLCVAVRGCVCGCVWLCVAVRGWGA